MIKAWFLTDENTTLLTPSGRKVKLPRLALDLADCGSIAAVLLSYRDADPLESARNVVAYDQQGEWMWQVELASMTQGESPYTSIGGSASTIVLFNAIGFFAYVDTSSGKVLRVEETR